MRYREFQPAPHLTHLVSCYWTLDREYCEGAAQAETVWPDGRPELLFHYGCRYRRHGEPLDHGVLLGPLTRRLLLVSQGRIRLVAVRLHPWGLAGRLGAGVDQLTDAVIPIETLWGARGRRLVQRLGEAGEDEAVRALDTFLHGETCVRSQCSLAPSSTVLGPRGGPCSRAGHDASWSAPLQAGRGS